ncbi:hypothetical protein B7R22_04190 [Subtercola boreus]|uniref:Uncharacterized protein n=1 Tax=Subtercola boreus TaxID=120213 RepID=A0A3E0W549_9MICO|nr:hypothetical protein [Subtercola boreus]RFA16673.1 hypothetical protein B7R22_04190 [Subtercola boreus]
MTARVADQNRGPLDAGGQASAVIYRGRPVTVTELAALSHLAEDEAWAAVDDLRARCGPGPQL